MPKPNDQMIEIERLKQMSTGSFPEPEVKDKWPSGWFILPLALIGATAIAAAAAFYLGV